MRYGIIILALFITFLSLQNCQSNSSKKDLQERNNETTYLFYLHGGVVQQQGANAVSEYYGPYKYLDLLDTLRSYGFEVISEVRPKGVTEEAYARKVSGQIDSLLALGVKKKNMVVAGASLGAYITMDLALMRKDPDLNFALLGLCSDYVLEYYQDRKDSLCGNFLSIYEKTDEKGPCLPLFSAADCPQQFKEIGLQMGNGHGFLYRPYPEWVRPLVEWIKD